MSDTMIYTVASVTVIVLVFCAVMYALIFAQAARVVRTIGSTHRPVQFVTHKFGVTQHGLVALEPGTRVLVPSGPYRGFWETKDRGPWIEDNDRDAKAGDTVTDALSRQMYVCTADGDWVAAQDLVFGNHGSASSKSLSYLVDGEMRPVRFDERGPELVMRHAPDGPYMLVTADGNVHPAAVVHGRLHSSMRVSEDGTRVCGKHAARAMPAPAFLRGSGV